MTTRHTKPTRLNVARLLTYASAATATWATNPLGEAPRGAGAYTSSEAPDTFNITRPTSAPQVHRQTFAVTSPANLVPMHADKIGFYIVPDIDTTYLADADDDAAAPCRWPKLLASFQKVKALLPEVQLRWDNELGHNNNTATFVEHMVQCANASDIPMIITASAVDGYNNFWANNDTQPTVTIEEIAEGPYLAASHDLLQRYSNIPWVETINEVDGIWFVADADNVTGFDLYMDNAISAFGDDAGRLLGPSTAYRNSAIYNAYIQRPNITDISYHNYGGAQSLTRVPGKTAWITEYGGAALNPAAILSDSYAAIVSGILNDDPVGGSIGMLFYNQLTDNGDNRGALNNAATEGDHFALRDWCRALTLLRATAAVAPNAYTDFNGDFLAADDGQGAFAALMWNTNDATALSAGSRSIFNVSLAAGTPLFTATLVPGNASTVSCAPLGAQQTMNLTVEGGTAVLRPRNLPPLAAALVTTQPCYDLAN